MICKFCLFILIFGNLLKMLNNKRDVNFMGNTICKQYLQ